MENKIKEMEVLLEKMHRLLETIKLSPALTSKFELDMLMHYTKQFYTLIPAIEAMKENDKASEVKQPDNKPLKTTPHVEPEAEKIKPVVPVYEIPETKLPEVKIPEEIKPEKKEEIKTPEIKPVVEEKKESPQVNIPVNKKPLISNDKHTDEDEISAGLHSKLSKDKKNKAIDLRTAIDLNDKLFLIRELFRGDHNTYDKVIRAINDRMHMADAKNYIENELVKQYGWNQASPGVQRLYEVLKEKFE